MASLVTSNDVLLEEKVSANQRLGWACSLLNHPKNNTSCGSREEQNYLNKSPDFTFSSSVEEVKNVSANQKTGPPSWIFNTFKKIQHFFRTPRGTFVASLVTGHTKHEGPPSVFCVSGRICTLYIVLVLSSQCTVIVLIQQLFQQLNC